MTGTSANVIIRRPTSRILVVAPDDRVLFFFARLGHSVEPERRPDALGFWALPGGGLERGETHADAAIRELREETGMSPTAPLPCIAHRDVVYPWNGRRYRAIERYYLYRSPSHALDDSGWQDGDKRWMSRMGWWHLDDLDATGDIIRPPGLMPLARTILAGAVPQSPVALQA
ncbi:MAG: NUDIX domain-containing protein [Hyphomicrobiaceae bacterium]